jgi:hypothetical protein
MSKNVKKLLYILKKIEVFNDEIKKNIIETNENPDIKMDFLIMNIIPKFIFMLTELKEILVNHNDSIIITTTPIGYYNDNLFICDKDYNKDGIIELIQIHGKKIIIYGEKITNHHISNIRYLCAIVDEDTTINSILKY